jgi:hypothetical protein
MFSTDVSIPEKYSCQMFLSVGLLQYKCDVSYEPSWKTCGVAHLHFALARSIALSFFCLDSFSPLTKRIQFWRILKCWFFNQRYISSLIVMIYIKKTRPVAKWPSSQHYIKNKHSHVRWENPTNPHPPIYEKMTLLVLIRNMMMWIWLVVFIKFFYDIFFLDLMKDLWPLSSNGGGWKEIPGLTLKFLA